MLPILSTHRRFDEIAERPQVSRHTVKSHVVSKLGASSRGEAVDLAIEIGLLEPFPGLRLTARAALDGPPVSRADRELVEMGES